MAPSPAADAEALVERVLAGEPRAVARAISFVEDDAELGGRLLQRLHRHTGRAVVVGVTGPPGAGKSTLVDRLVAHLRSHGRSVGVLAVDPSSPFSGGAILGDRVRMVGHTGDAGVFVRSMATRGHLGGLARATGDAVSVLDASGKDVVLVETVGVGQDEVDVARAADVTLVVLVPGAGDDVQALKAGLMEIADVYVVNKADREGADRLVETVVTAQSYRTPEPDEWRPPVVKTEAVRGVGVAEVWEAVDGRLAWARAHGAERRRARDADRLRAAFEAEAARQVERALPPGAFDRAAARVVARDIDPRTAAEALVREVMTR